MRILLLSFVLTLVVLIMPEGAYADPLDDPLLQRRGSEFTGGGAAQVGNTFFGESSVNVVYVQQPSGDSSARLTTEFHLDHVPGTAAALVLFLTGRDDDAPQDCPIEIRLNDTILYRGGSGFPSDRFQTKSFPIPVGSLRRGQNKVVITNTASMGVVGQPPWFMVSSCLIVPEGFNAQEWKRRNVADFYVRLPEAKSSFWSRNDAPGDAKMAPPVRAVGAFSIRGTKGYSWTPEQYMAEIPTLAGYRMNFLMNCYLSMFSNPMGQQGGPGTSNEWWLPIPDEKKRAYEKVFDAARKNRIDFCFAVHPQLYSPRPLDPSSDDDFEKFWAHFAWAQSKGVKWFSVPLDDVHVGGAIRIDGAEHARFVNKLFARLRKRDPEAQLVFCPTWYWGDGTDPEHRPYLEALARDLHPDIYIFWTGPSVVPARITRKEAETFKGIVKHRVILWENYPTNDGSVALHLGPLVGRDKDLGKVLDGIMSNPPFTENEGNRLPLFTIADYAWDPLHYDPLASIGRAILHEAQTSQERAALKDLVELFPGRVPHPGYNAVIEQYKRIAAMPHSRYIAALYIEHVQAVQHRLEQVFPSKYTATKTTLQRTVARLRDQYKAQYEQP